MIDPAIDPAITNAARCVPPSTPVREAAQHLRDPSVPALVVRDDADELVGVVTESDLVALLAETDEPTIVAQCMSSPVTTIAPGATITEAADLLNRTGVTLLPVVEENGTYHGVVSTTTLAPYVSRRSVDVEWRDEPLRVEPSAGDAVRAHD